MKAQVGPSSKELKTVEEFNKFLEKSEPVIIGFFKEESDLSKAFKKLTEKRRLKYTFAHSSAADVLAKQGLEDGIVLFRPKILHNKFEADSVQFEGKVDVIEEFIIENTHGLVGIRTRDSLTDFKEPLVVAYYAVDYVKNPKGTNYWRNRILKVAKEFAGVINFAITAKDDFQHELNEFGLDFVKGDKPVVFARSNKLKYVMPNEFS